MQWETLASYLRERKYDEERNDSVYQDNSRMAIDINHYFCDLNLLTKEETNPYIKILKLVWDEYEDVLREKSLVLPWFKLLGWA